MSTQFASQIDSKMMELTNMISSVKEIAQEIKQSLAEVKEKKKDNNQIENKNISQKNLRLKEKLNLNNNENHYKIKISNDVNNSNLDFNQKNLEINQLVANSDSSSNNSMININNNNIYSNMPNYSQKNQNNMNHLTPFTTPQIPINYMLPQNNVVNLPIQNMNKNSNQINSNINSQIFAQQPTNNMIIGQQIQSDIPIKNKTAKLSTIVNLQSQNKFPNDSVNNQVSSAPTANIQNGISLGGSFNNMISNQAQASVLYNNPVQLQNNNTTKVELNQNIENNKNSKNIINQNKSAQELNQNIENNKNSKNIINQKKSELKNQEFQKLSEKRTTDSNKIIAHNQNFKNDNQQINRKKNNNNIPNNINNIRQSPSSKKSPIIKPNFVNKKPSALGKKPQPKNSNSPFLSNSFDNLEDDEVMEISANNHKALQKSKQVQKKNKSYDFDEDYQP
jgi:hypothetical protein